MLRRLRTVFDDSATDVRAKLIGIYAVLAVLNVGAWLWAFLAFNGNPVLLSVALVVYGLGMRHAVDADHIAAIDNVTRKLMQNGDRPVAVGFFFALGHSSVVVIATIGVAMAASFQFFQEMGGTIQTALASLFLLAIAAMNIVILVSIYKTYRHVRKGGAYVEEDFDLLLNNRGFLARIFRPMFRMVTKSWLMFPLGFLFGLGFDTATEVAVFGITAAQAAKGMSIAAIVAFPLLFAAGMSLIDTTDGVLMLRAYHWAFVKPMRKLYYNMTITAVSVMVALLIGGIEGLGLLADKLGFTGSFWEMIGGLNDNFNSIGFLIIGVFMASWAISFVIYKVKGLDNFEVARAPEPLLVRNEVERR